MNALAKFDANLEEVAKWGEFLKNTGLAPKEYNSYQLAAIVQAGREIGLGPMQSLRSIHIINSRLTLGRPLKWALARRVGVKVRKIEGEDGKWKRVTLERDGELVTVESSVEKAQRMGWMRAGSVWERDPDTMMMYDCLSQGANVLAPEIALGFLAPDEAEAIPEVAEPATLPEPELAETATLPEPELAETATLPEDEQVQRMVIPHYEPRQVKARMEELGFSHPEQIALRACIREAGVEPAIAAHILMQAEDRAEALKSLSILGVKVSAISPAAGSTA